MNDLRTAAQQALEALEHLAGFACDHSRGICVCEYRDAADALRAALAQKHDPVAHSGWVLREVLFDNGEPIGHREPQHSPAALAQQAEPGVRGAAYADALRWTIKACGAVQRDDGVWFGDDAAARLARVLSEGIATPQQAERKACAQVGMMKAINGIEVAAAIRARGQSC